MGKKKFIDKKKSATFCLLARDSSDPIYTEEPENDRVFVRVDNNSVSIGGLDENPDHGSDYENDPNSIFADAPEDVDFDYEFGAQTRAPMQSMGGSATLPDHIRKEIIELGFPDDGYNYLTHLREIRNTGGGSSYYENPKSNLHDLPHDVKAYDASRVRIKEAIGDHTSPKVLYNVAEKTVNVRVKKVDAEIAKLLEENDSEFGSDIEDLEEDFVLQANFAEDSEIEDIYSEKGSTSITKTQEEELYKSDSVTLHEILPRAPTRSTVVAVQCFTEKPRVERLLDEQFDLLEQQEYGTDSDDDGDYNDFLAQEDSSLAEKLGHVLIKGRKADDLDLAYEVPADFKEDGKVVSSAADIVRKCAEYGKKYEIEDEAGQEFVIVEESSDESEIWDCETIVTTYSNLDNHPGRITTPGYTRKKKLADTLTGALKSISENTISLGGRAKLPLDYLPQGRKAPKEKVKVEKVEQLKRKLIGQESKEEKKERKAAVKEEKREARRLKKDTKGLYRDEAKLAQKVAAVSGPSSIHLS